MEKFSSTPNLLHFHGTGAFDVSRFENWDSFLMELVHRKHEKIIIRAKQRYPGASGTRTKNPYVKVSYLLYYTYLNLMLKERLLIFSVILHFTPMLLQPKFRDFEIDIDPPSLASRILSIREQISTEWIEDLNLVVRSGDLILDSYFDNVARERDNDEYLEDSVNALGSPNEEQLRGEKSQVFERAALAMMSNLNPYEGMSSSPFRKGNFDLLHLLATQESIHRVLRELKDSGSEAEASFIWLRDFYCDRIPDFFDGNQKYGRYDDFLEELLLSNPQVKREGKGQVSIVDPVGLAEKIIRARGDVAREWKEVMSNTPQDHTDVRRNILSKRMEVSVPEPPIIIGEFE